MPVVDRYTTVAYGLSDSNIFFPKDDGLARMPKQGGAITMLVAKGYPYLSFFAADEDGVAAVNGYGLMRCNGTEPCTFSPSINGGHRLAMDKDWVYYRRNVVSDDVLARSARRGESKNAYDLLDAKVGPFGFIVVDDTRVYFTRPTKDPSFGLSTSIVSLSKEPGGAPLVLVESSGISSQGGGLVDDFWVYWVSQSKILAVPKNGPATTPLVVGTSCRDNSAPATDGQRLYWPSTEGGIDSAPVPKRP